MGDSRIQIVALIRLLNCRWLWIIFAQIKICRALIRILIITRFLNYNIEQMLALNCLGREGPDLGSLRVLDIDSYILIDRREELVFLVSDLEFRGTGML